MDVNSKVTVLWSVTQRISAAVLRYTEFRIRSITVINQVVNHHDSWFVDGLRDRQHTVKPSTHERRELCRHSDGRHLKDP